MADVSYSSITPSSASYASSVFPVLDGPTSELVDSIVSRVATGASDWKPVLQAYKEEFDARSLDGETDTVVYGLLLRLGMERGNDWRSKWESVKRQQQVQDVAASAKTPRRAPVDIAKPDVFRRLQEGSAQKTPLQSTKHKQQFPQALTQEALAKLQSTSSPYKKSYRTPRAEVDAFGEDVGTPIVPRVHFATSAHAQQLPQEAFNVHVMNPASTPEGKEAMMNQAIRFDRLVLLGRMMDDWLSRIAVLQKLDIHTELARNALLSRRSIHVWQDRVVRHRDLVETAGKAHEATAKRRCLGIWRDKAEQVKKTRWEKQLHVAYRTVARKQERHIREAVLSHWFQQFLDTRCAKFRKTSLLRTTLTRWLSQSAHLAEIESEADALLEDSQTNVLRDCLETWRMKTVLLRREEAFAEQVDAKIAMSAFSIWRERTYDSQASEEILAVSTLRNAFSRWKARVVHVRSLESQSEAQSLTRSIALVRKAFHTWKIAEHGQLLLHARKSRILRGTLLTWRDRSQHHTVVQVVQADAFRKQQNALVLSTVLKLWQSRLLQRDKAVHLAASLSDRLTLQRSLQSWQRAHSAHRLEARKAQVARNFFLQRGCLNAWHKHMKGKKAAAWIEERRTKAVREVFDTWRESARRSIRDTALVQRVEAAVDQRIVTVSLRKWTNRVIDIRARELSVSADRANALLANALSRWRAITARHAEDLSLVDSFVEVQDEQLSKRYFRRWLTKARRDRTLKSLLKQKLQDDEQALVVGCFDRWIDRFREDQLLQEEEQVLAYRQQQALTTMFARWKGRTMTLPAIRFDSDRLRRAAFHGWKEALPGRIDLNRAIAFHDEKLLTVTFSIWDEARRAKAARRAANRFRAFSANGSRPRTSPSALALRATARTPSVMRSPKTSVSPAPVTITGSRTVGIHASPATIPHSPMTSTPTKVKRATGLVPPFSAARLRQEVQPRSSALSSRLVQPEAVALPPSSSASAVSEGDASRQGTPGIGNRAVAVGAEERRDRSRSRSRRDSQTEEGILKGMRERLAAVGLGEGIKSRNAR